MRCRPLAIAAMAAAATWLGQSADALKLTAPGDFIIAVNQDQDGSRSNHPDGEPPSAAIGGTAGKYLNFARASSGIIVTPAGGSSVVQSLVLTTANDAQERDPASFLLYGTNGAITSVNNSPGGIEDWTLIASGALDLPTDRNTAAAAVDFANAASYSSYRLSFPTVRGPGGNSMQIDDIALFTDLGGAGTNVLSAGDPVIAIANSYPEAEGPAKLIDGDTGTKYLSFGKENTGVIVTPSVGPSVLTRFSFNLANDSVGFPGRDPVDYEVYGTNDPISSLDDSTGMAESWTLLSSGSLAYDPADFGKVGPIGVNATEYFTSYKVLFTGLRDSENANSLQISELELIGSVPEPSTVALVGLGLVGLVAGRRFGRR